jgi:hypothetical protein
MKTKTMRTAASFAMLLLLAITFSVDSAQAAAATDTETRLKHSRAFESIIWSVPLMNYKAIRDGLKKGAGVDYGDVAYHSKIQSWKFEIPTGNAVPYVLAYWTLKDGPLVIEIPKETKDVSLFGVMMDSWQRPIGDVGGRGRDGGLGAKYLLLPPNYRGDLPEGHLVLKQKTYEGYFLLRPLTADNSAASMQKQADWAKQIKIYPLAKANKPSKTKHIDAYGKRVHAIVDYDASYFEGLHEILGQEYLEEKDLAILGLLESIGIRKDAPFKADKADMKIFAAAAKEAHAYLRDGFLAKLGPVFYKGKKWFSLNLPGSVTTEFSYVHPTYVDLDTRAAMYFGVFSSAERLGAATYYLLSSKDSAGQWLDGGENYKLNVPANVPVSQFWSVIAHDNETASWITDIPEGKEMVGSLTEGLKKNQDGSVDVYFGPKAPKGESVNWLPTVKGKRFFLLFRFYGTKPAVFDQSWQLNDVQKVK